MRNISRYLADVSTAIASLPAEEIAVVVKTLLRVYQADGKVFIMGNGGSAATTSHFACDLAKGTLAPGRSGFRVLSLIDNVPRAAVADLHYHPAGAGRSASAKERSGGRRRRPGGAGDGVWHRLSTR